MQKSIEELRQAAYVNSPYDLTTPLDDAYRNGVDEIIRLIDENERPPKPKFRIGDIANGVETSEEIIEAEDELHALRILISQANLYCEEVQ